MNKYLKILACAIAVQVSGSSLVSAQTTSKTAKAPAADVIPLDPAVKIGKLPNGFTYYIRKNVEPKNRVQLYLANKVGSILENDDQQGLLTLWSTWDSTEQKTFLKMIW